ncbi:hypothetical protein A0H76_2874 [Hepatospora eriocheir]|uniref:Uncharacterized protein n=1 Tax=Hepatospora eriocheir TaxID=1081669 RepID=A0A1X0Q5B5_9MICR|nr:hypothetical protein A0H76_2874 [Hepatospora eriocheir]
MLVVFRIEYDLCVIYYLNILIIHDYNNVLFKQIKHSFFNLETNLFKIDLKIDLKKLEVNKKDFNLENSRNNIYNICNIRLELWEDVFKILSCSLEYFEGDSKEYFQKKLTYFLREFEEILNDREKPIKSY